MDVTKEMIRIDSFDRSYSFGQDQMYVDFPAVFAVVTIPLLDTQELNAEIDRQRVLLGYKPMFTYAGDYDSSGWYDFSIGFYGGNGIRLMLQNCIEATVVNPIDKEDEGSSYEIWLTDEQRKLLLSEIDQQCRIGYGMTCEELLGLAMKEVA